MTDSLEERIAALEKEIAGFWAKPAVIVASELAKYFWRMETPGMAEHFETEREKPALFAIKHQHMIDPIASLYPFLQVAKKKPVIPVKKSQFGNAIVAAFLEAAGAIPITRPNDKGYAPNSAEARKRNREMVRNFRNRGWYAYCPEGTRKPGIVGLIEPEYLKPILLAARMGVDVYIVGVEYKRTARVSPWVPFLTGITVRFKKYEPNGKSIEQVTCEVRETLAKLSGLEGKLEAGQARTAVSGTPARSAAGYN